MGFGLVLVKMSVFKLKTTSLNSSTGFIVCVLLEAIVSRRGGAEGRRLEKDEHF